MISLIRLLLLLLRLLLLCECARDLNFTVPFVWARMNELIRNRTPPIRIRVESQEIEEFLLNFVFSSAFFYSLIDRQKVHSKSKQELGLLVPIIPRRVYNLIEE